MATQSSILAERNPRTEEPGGLLSIGSHRVGHGWNDLACVHALEKEMATHSRLLAWRIPGTEEPGGLSSMGSHRIGHDWSDLACTHELEKEMATHSSVLAWRIPGTEEPGGLSSMGSHRVRHDWSDLAAAAVQNILKLLVYFSFDLCYSEMFHNFQKYGFFLYFLGIDF